MTFDEKITFERDNKSEIHLYIEGIFFKAYEHSAFLFQRHIAPFKLSKRYVKTVRMDVVSLGFPSNALEKLAGGKPIVEHDERHVSISGFTLDEEDFKRWKDDVPSTVPISEKDEKNEDSKPVRSRFGTTVSTVSDIEKEVLKKLSSFRVESSTPLDCIMFITTLQKQLSNS